MNKSDVKKIVETLEIPKDDYALEKGFINEQYVLEENGENWEVYYGERGGKTSLKIFKDEEDACLFFLKWIITDNDVLKMLAKMGPL